MKKNFIHRGLFELRESRDLYGANETVSSRSRSVNNFKNKITSTHSDNQKMQKTGRHQTFYEEIKCFINSLKAISQILEKLLLYDGEKIEIFSCQNSNKLPTIMFIRQGDNFKTISFIFQTGDNRKLPPSALLEFLDLRNC